MTFSAPDWDADSPELRLSLTWILQQIVRSASRRERPALESARRWQHDMVRSLAVPDPRYIGAFRGEPGLEDVQVRVLATYGTAASEVSAQLKRFEGKLQELVAELDSLVPAKQEPNSDQLAAIIDLCAWVHTEWVRIHPFANGNGRTARLWANSIALRYGLPPFVRLRPRPNGGYGAAGAKAMQGDWKPTAKIFRLLLNDLLNAVYLPTA